MNRDTHAGVLKKVKLEEMLSSFKELINDLLGKGAQGSLRVHLARSTTSIRSIIGGCMGLGENVEVLIKMAER